MANQVKRRQLIRWLERNGFAREPRVASGHGQWKRANLKVTVVMHGSSDISQKDVSILIRALERAGFDRAKVQQELREL